MMNLVLLKAGWIQGGGDKWYYTYADGTMAKNTTTPDGYRVNDRGVLKK